MMKRDSHVPPTRRSGAYVVEAAVILPFFLLLMMGIFEYCRFLMIRNLTDHATFEGARFAVVHTYDKTTADVQQKVNDFLAGQQGQLSGLNIDVFKANPDADPNTNAKIGEWTDARFGDWIMVKITGNYTPALPSFLMMPSTISLRAQTMMRCEAN
jgi:hypothetical protein